MNPYYNQNYTWEEVDEILGRIKECISHGRYTVARNAHRQENIDFKNKYHISYSKQQSILLGIQTNDFCHSLQNIKIGYTHEVLYVFVPQVELINNVGEVETVDIYVKFNIIELRSGDQTIVVSFHERNKPITYLFR